MIGSEGTLGIITELTLKLIAPPACHCSLIVPFENLADAIGSVPEIKHSNLKPQALEFFEKEMLETTEAYMGTSVFRKWWKEPKSAPIFSSPLMPITTMNWTVS